MSRRFVVAALALGAVVAVTAAPVEVQVGASRATIGDRIPVRLLVEAGDGRALRLPTIETWGVFEVTAGSWSAVEDAPGQYALDLTLTAWETGVHPLSPLTLTADGPDGEETFETPETSIVVASVLPDDEEQPEIADIKGPARVPPDLRGLKVALASLAGLLLLALAAWWLHRRYAARLAAVDQPDDLFARVPPHEWAYGELQKLLERRFEPDHAAEFFAEVTHVVKRYLGARFRADLLERTSAEVPRALDTVGAPRDAVARTRNLLEHADRVKFAREAADALRLRETVEEAYRIIDLTRPRDEPAQEGAA